MSNRGYYFILLASHAFFFFFLFDPIIRSDGVLYFWSIHSPIIDGDLDFSNQLLDFPLRWMHDEVLTSTGLVFQVTNIGSSLLNAPLFLTAHLISILAKFPTDGYSIVYTFFFNLGSVVYSFFGSVFLFKAISQYFGYRKSDALLTTLLVVLATPIVVYSLGNASFSTAHSFFAVSLMILIWSKYRNENNSKYWIFIGLSVGLIFMVRTVDAVFVFLPIIDAMLFKRKEFFKNPAKIRYIAIYIVFVLIAFAPHMYFWNVLYGEPIPWPMPLDQWYELNDDPRGSFMNWTEPHFLEFFFSEHRGLFTWSPIYLLALAGIYFLYKKQPEIAIMVLIMSSIIFYVHAAPNDWWGGGSYGQRRAADITPFLALGLVALFERIGYNLTSKIIKSIIFSSFIIWNIIFFTIFKWEHLVQKLPFDFRKDLFPFLSDPLMHVDTQIQKSFVLNITKIFFGEHRFADQTIWLFLLSIPSIILILFALIEIYKNKRTLDGTPN